MGVLLKQNIVSLFNSLSTLYSKLGNIAFWSAQDKADAAPDALDWQVPKKALTITNSLEHSVVSYNGEPVSGSVLVDAGETIDLLVSGAPGYVVSSVTAQGATVIDNQDDTFTVRVKVNDDMSLTISGTVVVVVVVVGITTSNQSGALGLSNTSAQQGGTFVGEITFVDDYFNNFEITSVKDTSNNNVAYTLDGNEITIANVPSDLTITAVAKKTLKLYSGKTLNRHSAVVDEAGGCFTDYIRLEGLSAASVLKWYYGYAVEDVELRSGHRCMNFYDKNKKLMYYSEQWDAKWNPIGATVNGNNYRDIATSIVSNALNIAGANIPVYARISIMMNGANLVSGAALKQGNTDFFDPTDVEFATAPTIHNVTYNNNGSATCNCESLRPNVIDGENFETLITGTINTLTVTMGGVDITQSSWKTSKKIIIDSVTGALVITIT